MKSLRETLGWPKRRTSLDVSPKSASGILPHSEEKKFNDLWINIVKSEDGFKKLESELNNYQAGIKGLHDTDEKFVNTLGDTNIGAFCPDIRKILDEYLSFILETKEKNHEVSLLLRNTLCESTPQYHSLYEHLDNLRKKRDASIVEVQRCQDKFDKLKLKGKRTTDVIVEKEKNIRRLKELHSQIIHEGTLFDDLRVPLLDLTMLTLVQTQVDYYGTSACELNNHIHLSRGYSSLKDPKHDEAVKRHLGNIRKLKIVEL